MKAFTYYMKVLLHKTMLRILTTICDANRYKTKQIWCNHVCIASSRYKLHYSIIYIIYKRHINSKKYDSITAVTIQIWYNVLIRKIDTYRFTRI